MGLFDWLRKRGSKDSSQYGMDEWARRLGLAPAEFSAVDISYHAFTIPKRSGGTRQILAPAPALKTLQRRILRRLIARLKSHPCVTGFERGHSIVTNALPHAGRAVVVRMDIRNSFGSTTESRILAYFQRIGWASDAAKWLTRVCTYQNGLPQGAPTSPRLANLVNYQLDAYLEAAGVALGAS